MKLAEKPVLDTSIHSFFLSWRRTHKKRQTWKEQRTMSWEEVTCGLCLVHKPQPGAPSTPKKP
jgi:hypothetical protein